MEKSVRLDKLTLGVCYYPEHWDPSLWEDDLRRMGEHGLSVIRIGEFAWGKIEPTEGDFTPDFFSGFLDLAHRAGISVILGTPSATPPAWLTHKYPEVLNAVLSGVLMRHGMRRHYNYNSPKYRELVARVVAYMARQFGPHPAVVGWQIDNELNCEVDRFYSDADHAAFRAYLMEKFATLEALNDALGMAFWDQRYTDWEQVFLTRPSAHPAMGNPHLQLEESRFISKSAIDFCALQADILRSLVPENQFITTNGLFGNLDSHAMTARCLDFMCYDCYPQFAFAEGARPGQPDALDDRSCGWGLSRTRSISPNFVVMEQQSGGGGWTSRMRSPMPKPGQMRLWTWQSVAHGADLVSYFRWRTCAYGTEMYWHGLNDYDNRPNRRLAELMGISREVESLPGVAGTGYEAKAALIMSYANEWDARVDVWHGRLDEQSIPAWFAAAQHTHTPLDALYIGDDTAPRALDGYKLLVWPHGLVLTPAAAALLTGYVQRGGTLVVGARTGQKDETGRCPMAPLPGPLADLCAARVVDYTALGPGDGPQTIVWDGEALEAPVFNDVLAPLPGAKVLGVYTGNYYAGQPGLIMNRVGEGAVYTFGGAFGAGAAEALLRRLGCAEPYDALVSLPRDVEIAVRRGGGRAYYFVLNYQSAPRTAALRRPMTDGLTDRSLCGDVVLPPYGVLVLTTD